MFSPLEQFEILPILQIPFIITNASLILIIGVFFLVVYLFIQNKFIPTYIQQILEIIYNTTLELAYSNIGKNGRYFFFINFCFIVLCFIM